MYTGWGLEPVSPAQSTSDVNFDMCHKPIKNPSNTPWSLIHDLTFENKEDAPTEWSMFNVSTFLLEGVDLK